MTRIMTRHKNLNKRMLLVALDHGMHSCAGGTSQGRTMPRARHGILYILTININLYRFESF